ncbi:hypothetical protein DPMN_064625 [Dreissena polymorpha]|uniref:Uncharacterized protein n=1 Tax=Dreissena polymorpha TaxID=45954 RepID=A0A9D4CDX2_DREPO|nr:hypothetical protein DPMN_064625 [Dreissena polymorpha]
MLTDSGQRPILKSHLSNQAKNVTSIVNTAPPPLARDIYKTNLFTKFHDDWAKNVTSRVFTSFFYYITSPGSHVIQLTGTIFKVNSHINETNVLTKFHENWVKNVTSRVFTLFTRKTAQPTASQPYFIGTKLLTKFHRNQTKNVASRVFTNKCKRTDGQTMDKDRSHKLT